MNSRRQVFKKYKRNLEVKKDIKLKLEKTLRRIEKFKTQGAGWLPSL